MLIIYKNEGETPLEALERLRIEQPKYKDAVLSYAGRLDPMAEGDLLVLVDENNKDREKYLGLNKVYEVEILFGVSTDTGDILGLVHDGHHLSHKTSISPFDIEQCQTSLQTFVGKFPQQYPHYSSRTVDGKPLFQWAREGKLGEIVIPNRDVEIYSIEFIKSYEISASDLLKKVKERIKKVKGDFRQEEVIASWEKSTAESMRRPPGEMVPIMQIRVSCSSGTYMRALAQKIGEKQGIPALAWTIRRTLLF